MDAQQLQFLAALAAHGEAYDAVPANRATRLLNITPATGQFLALLLRATRARQVLEIGTSNGYSTAWLAEAVQAAGGHVTTLEISAEKVALAADTLRQLGVQAVVTQVRAAAAEWLPASPAASFDFVFLDADRAQYAALWPQLLRVLRPGGLLVADNATSHPADFAPLLALVRGTAEVEHVVVPVGKGELLVWKAA